MRSDSPIIHQLADPVAFERRAVALAGLVRGRAPDGVMAWDDPVAVVLSHIVARELGVRSIRCFDHDGLVGLDAPLPDGPTVALVVPVLEDLTKVRAMLALAEQHGRAVVAVGALEVPAGEVDPGLGARGVPLLSADWGPPHG